MPILNYTTSVDVDKTVGEITRILSRRRAKSILIEYDERGDPAAISFLVATAFGDRAFRLPANADGVFQALVKQHRQGVVAPRFVNKSQAARIGWRIVKDWLEAQCAIVEAEMASMEEVMLPYLVTAPGRTLFEDMKERQLALPAPDGMR